MSFPPAYSTCYPFSGSGAATDWVHVYNFENEFVWTCYFFASKVAPILMNTAIAVGLIIDKCDAMQAEIDALGEPAEVNMTAIINAMLQAEFYHLEQFIGCVDGYRTILMNEPFDVHFYETLVRMFAR